MATLQHPYDVLVPWCKQAEHANQTDAERWSDLTAKTITVTRDRWASLRTIAGILSPDEYDIVRQSLDAAAQTRPVIADAVAMLAQPGDDLGNGGGLNFGHPTVRAMCDQILAGHPDIAAKLKAFAEEKISQIEQWAADSVTVREGHLASARQLISEGA